MTDVVRDTNPDLDARLAEISQMLDAPSSHFSAGEWCEAANELMEALRVERVRREKAETALRGMVCETCGIGMWESREGFCDSCSEARAVLAGEGDARELERRLEESLGLGGEGDEPVR